MRVQPLVAAQVDRAPARPPRPPTSALGQLALRRRQREDRAAVVGVGVQVEQPGGREAPLELLENRAVAALADVGTATSVAAAARS